MRFKVVHGDGKIKWNPAIWPRVRRCGVVDFEAVELSTHPHPP